MQWTAFRTLVVRECGVIFRFWSVTLAPPVIATILYFTIFGEIIGRRIGSIDGVNYDQYVAPGLIVMSIVPGSYAHTAGGLLGARVFKYLEELLVSPMTNFAIATGYVVAGLLRGLITGLAVAVISLFFARLHVHSGIVSIASLVLAALIAAVFGLIVGTLARSFDHVTSIQVLIITPLTFIAGVFAPVPMLPGWAQELSVANPMFHVVNLLRYGLLGISDASVVASFSVIAGVTTLLSLLSVVRFRERANF
jgi:ABC-2 type transport system permease protein